MKLLSTITVGAGGASTIDFTSIPQTATDICFLFSLRTSESAIQTSLRILVNGVTTGYSNRYIAGQNNSVINGTASTSIFGGWVNGASTTSGTFGNGTVYFPNYSSSVIKGASVDSSIADNANNGILYFAGGSTGSTNAITSVSFAPGTSTSFVQGSTVSLYTYTKGSSSGATVTP